MSDIFETRAGNSPLYENQQEVKILAGQSETALVNGVGTGGTVLCLIVIPANFSGTKLSFLVNNEKNGTGNFIPYYNAAGSKVELTNLDTAIAAEGGAVAIGLSLIDFAPIQSFRLKSDVNQVADSTFQLFTRRA
jgi:hypothetical protein